MCIQRQTILDMETRTVCGSVMDNEQEEEGVLSILTGREGCNEEYSSISEFKHHLKESDLADEKVSAGWVLWRSNEQQLNNKITTLFEHVRPWWSFGYMVQFWGVVKVEGRPHHLSTSHHPFFVRRLRKGNCWYRNKCRDHVEEEDGPVGRAYRNKHPESTPDLRLYSANEFPLRDHAARFGFRFYLALPLFHLDNSDDNECCGVLELLSHWDRMDGGLISSLYEELQVVGLRSTHIKFTPISSFKSIMLDKYKQKVDTEIRELLTTVIHALPRLSLAQVWVYCKQCVNRHCMERAYYVTASASASSETLDQFSCTDKEMFDYLLACEFHHLQLDSNHFHQNLKDRSISMSQLEHYAQRARLSHRFAIWIQSVDNSKDPFVIEFFLQPECSSLHLLSRIIQMKLNSFRCQWEGQLLEIFQSSQPNEIECGSVDLLKVMNSSEEEYSESNFKEYLDTIDASCCLQPANVDSKEGWVFSCPSRERLCENDHANSSTVYKPELMKARIEKIMKKMAKQSERGYWIVQFWAPKIAEGRCYLETSSQPYAIGCLAKCLASFRKECIKHHYFVDDEANEEELGPPGRVFRNKSSEFALDLLLYSTKEFSMRNYAMHCGLQNYFVLPVIDKCKRKCAGVLEFIGFGYSAHLSRALKDAKLWSTDHMHFPPRFKADQPAPIMDCRKNALKEVSDAFSLMTMIPHFHMAKMWVPYGKCSCISGNASCMELALSSKFIWERMPINKVHWIHVQPRKGMIGMTLESKSKSCFCRDLREFNIIDQPLALYDRREMVDVCFTIGLQSSLTGDITYVLEFFLKPSPDYVDSFFKFLLPIMKQELKSFKYACGKQLGEQLVVDVIEFSEASNLASSELGQLDGVPIKFRSVQYGQLGHQQDEKHVQNVSNDMNTEQCRAAASVSKKRKKGKRKNLSLKDLEPHFGKKLKDVAEELASRSTIKRSIKKLGIERWPCTEKQARNLRQLLDLQKNGPRSNIENLIVQEDVEMEMTIKGAPKMKGHETVVKERMVRSYHLLPRPLKMLCSYAENELNDGTGIPIALDDEIFGEKCKIYIHLEDIIPFCDLELISGNCIVVYILKLYNQIKKENKLKRFQFVNPFTISNGANTKSKRAYALAERLIVASPGQLVLVPCNVGKHWILTAIEPYKNVVSMLDPISHSVNDKIWEHIVNIAMNFFNSYMRYDAGTPIWEVIKVPLQPDSKQCGYYVMRFMKEIVESLNTIDFDGLSFLFVGGEYSQNDIDEVRIEWTNCVMNT